MTRFFWFFLGLLVMAGGQAVAQQWGGVSPPQTVIIQPFPGVPQPDWMGPSRQMGQQLREILQQAPRPPC